MLPELLSGTLQPIKRDLRFKVPLANGIQRNWRLRCRARAKLLSLSSPGPHSSFSHLYIPASLSPPIRRLLSARFLCWSYPEVTARGLAISTTLISIFKSFLPLLRSPGFERRDEAGGDWREATVRRRRPLANRLVTQVGEAHLLRCPSLSRPRAVHSALGVEAGGC